ncbi:MAG TPA: RDD family protein [Acidimicrobiales bacterium]|nr:RDD family protein [Acidimicrobiales bacterium]
MPTDHVVRDVIPPGDTAVAPATGTTVPGDLRARRFGLPAAYWRRIVARLLDCLAVFWIEFALVVIGAAFWVRPLTDRVHPGPWGDAFIATITYAVFLVVYEVIFIAANGMTPGKDLLKIKVVRVLDGEKPTVAQAIRRSLVHAALAVVPKLWIASLAQFAAGITAPRSQMRRSLADHVAGTQVVYYDDPDGRPQISQWDRAPIRIGAYLFKR